MTAIFVGNSSTPRLVAPGGGALFVAPIKKSLALRPSHLEALGVQLRRKRWLCCYLWPAALAAARRATSWRYIVSSPGSSLTASSVGAQTRAS